MAGSCVDGNSTTVLPSDAGSTKTLVSFDLMEDRKYFTSVTVLYNGGVEQQSQSVEISEFVQYVHLLTVLLFRLFQRHV